MEKFTHIRGNFVFECIMMIVPGHLSDLIDLMRVELTAFPVDGYDINMLKRLITDSLVFLKMVEPSEMKIVGFAICMNMMGEESAKQTIAADLITLAIHPQYQGKGFGQRLMNRVMLELKKFGVKIVQLHVKTTNEPAIHIYQKFGFRVLETCSHYYDESKESAYRMVLQLP